MISIVRENLFLFKMTMPLTIQEIVDAFVKASDALDHMKPHLYSFSDTTSEIHQIRYYLQMLAKRMLTRDLSDELSTAYSELATHPEYKVLNDTIATLLSKRENDLKPIQAKIDDINAELRYRMHM